MILVWNKIRKIVELKTDTGMPLINLVFRIIKLNSRFDLISYIFLSPNSVKMAYVIILILNVCCRGNVWRIKSRDHKWDQRGTWVSIVELNLAHWISGTLVKQFFTCFADKKSSNFIMSLVPQQYNYLLTWSVSLQLLNRKSLKYIYKKILHNY